MDGVTHISGLFFSFLIIGLLQTPGCSTEGQHMRDHPDIVPKYINCHPQTIVTSCPQNDKYRTINGACNNRERPSLGVSDSALARWLPAEYEDRRSLPKGWIKGKLYNGHPLPLVREVSNKVVSSAGKVDRVDMERSQFFMAWGQLNAHDMSSSPIGLLNCTSGNSCDTDCINGQPENCFPIELPPSDPTAEIRGNCLQFLRVPPACNCESEMREPANMVTSCIDGSPVYGSQECYASMLKDKISNQGLLVVNQLFTDSGRAYMPFDDEVTDPCPPTAYCISKDPCPETNTTYNIPCFAAGDKRGNQNLPLLTINMLFFREHNRLAKELRRINQHWDGKRLYSETRKILVAMMQMITYYEYLPLVLGDHTDIELPPYKKYSEEVDPRTSAAFNIAFRWAHTSIPPYIFRLDEKYKPFLPDYKIPFHQAMFATSKMVKEGGIDPLLRGLLVNGAKLLEQSAMMSEELREKLFALPGEIGIDLASIDLQRGRELGLPMYNAWRRFCGLSAPSDLTELTAVLKNEKLAQKLTNLYKTPENIDLWIGAMSEPIVENGRVGPLFACLIGTQFKNCRDGDRLWLKNPGVFTEGQLHGLSTGSLSRIICDNSGLKEVPRNVFKPSKYPEDFVSCKSVNRLDLTAWREVNSKKGKNNSKV